ncbi:MAG: phosphoribosylformylglycinamidine synthase subunit PurS, partial [Candidatus Bathyarchaeia archaeon]
MPLQCRRRRSVLIHRIEVGVKTGLLDVRGQAKKNEIASFLGFHVDRVRIKRIYTLDISLTPYELTRVVGELFVNPVTEEERKLEEEEFDWVIEVGFKPGVTDSVGRTAKVAIEDLLGRKLLESEAVYTSTQYLITGKLSLEEVWRIGRELLANEVVENVLVLSHDEVVRHGLRVDPPVIRGTQEARVKVYDLNVNDEKLLQISREGLLALDLDEMKAIREYFSRPEVIAARVAKGLPVNPTDVEVEMLAQTWSEHCKHKIFNAKIRYENLESHSIEIIDSLFKTYIVKATEKAGQALGWLVSVFEDNAGVIAFNERLNVVAKVETHNSPSALDPYG